MQDKTLEKWGVLVAEEEVGREFAQMDENEGGAVLFDEFCHPSPKVQLLLSTVLVLLKL